MQPTLFPARRARILYLAATALAVSIIACECQPSQATLDQQTAVAALQLTVAAQRLTQASWTPTPTPAPSASATAAIISANDTPTPTPTASPSQALAPCANRYFPALKGATWTYAYVSVVGNSSRTSVVTDLGADTFTVQTQRTKPAANDAVRWNCTSDGLAAGEGSTEPLAMILQASQPDLTVNANPGAGVTLPTGLKAGDQWSQTRSGVVGSHTLSGTVSIIYQFRAMDEGPVTVPAGTFQALRVYGNATASLPDGSSLSYQVTYWYTVGVGLIQTETVYKTSVYHWQLASYNIP